VVAVSLKKKLRQLSVTGRKPSPAKH